MWVSQSLDYSIPVSNWLWVLFCEHFPAQCKFSASFSFTVCVCQSLKKERKELKVMIWGLKMSSLSPFFLSGHLQTCWKVFVGWRRYNGTHWSVHLRLCLCSCVPCWGLGKEFPRRDCKAPLCSEVSKEDISWPQHVALWAESLSLLKELNPWTVVLFFLC